MPENRVKLWVGGQDQLSLSRAFKIRQFREFYSRLKTFQEVILISITRNRLLRESNQLEIVERRLNHQLLILMVLMHEDSGPTIVLKRSMINPIQPWRRLMNLAALVVVKLKWSTPDTIQLHWIEMKSLMTQLIPTSFRMHNERTTRITDKTWEPLILMSSIRLSNTRRKLITGNMDWHKVLHRTHKSCCHFKKSKHEKLNHQREEILHQDA